MIIKAVTKKGDVVPQTAEEALKPAIIAALKTKNTQEVVYWADPTGTAVDSFRTTNTGDNGTWEAWATGSTMVGKTTTKDDRFFDPKPHLFDVHYKLGKNDIGLPEVVVVSFAMQPVNTNPQAHIGAFEKDERQTPLGEIQPQIQTAAKQFSKRGK
jgi:hypothetical protein